MTSLQQDYPEYYQDEKYNLCKIAFDPETGKFGEQVDTLFNAVAMGKSLTWPRPSYDGKYIMFTLMDYGYFSIWHNESDQWLLDLQTGEAREMKEINSDKADSYHNWNVNSHWFVFTSRRDDGLYGKPYFCYIGKDGKAHKPFCLPQEHPTFYDNNLKSFNAPELGKGKVPFDVNDVAKAMKQEVINFSR